MDSHDAHKYPEVAVWHADRRARQLVGQGPAVWSPHRSYTQYVVSGTSFDQRPDAMSSAIT